MSVDTVSLAMTGASGAVYGLRLLEELLKAQRQVYLMISSPARVVLATEAGLELPSQPRQIGDLLRERFGAGPGQLEVFGKEQWMAPVASGSNAPDAMVVSPCSMGTLSAIACGASNNLIERAADVMIKERRKLILLAREMPLSALHLENMLKLSREGVVIMPASPGFYHRPESVEALVDFVVSRLLDHLDIDHDLVGRWGDSA